ncbi:virulence factor SrfC family protein [Fulvivirgaceae bacterium BMA12]|uniref:Virulence factor SrfC family protein n=1 Tax=Agaribacillus aureus TaxID=3051825 RepID=A0ABT8LAC9_9BACT|nr:virulence factor SrfC family protein [Fulvivirgaceae bacterium BMA12]
MELSPQKLEKFSTVMEEAVRQAEDWLQIQKTLSDANKTNLANFLLNVRRYKKDLSGAIHQRPAIGIFGASQVGKSYLVSNLSKPSESDSLNVLIPGKDEEIDFVQKINPPGGGKEATGIVTRFTVETGGYQENFAPFRLRLFTQCDLVKIILNGYLSDINNYQYEIDREELQQLLKNHHDQVKAVSKDLAGFDQFDVMSLQEYVNKYFSNHFITRELNAMGFWEDLKTLLPKMHYSKRYLILEVMWGKHTFFSNLFNLASNCLEKIEFRSEIRCQLEALSPSSNTIIDVERLREIFTTDTRLPIAVYEGSTIITTLDRSILSLITAEVCLPIPPQTADFPNRSFLKQADILDFPGARSRNKILEQTFESNSDIEKLEVLLRGKVAYLFERYNEKFELSALIYCMDDSQQEVQDLPHLIYSWLSRTHGASDIDRQKKEVSLREYLKTDNTYNPLFVVQTKYNNDLQGNPSLEKEGDSSTHDWKWESRLEANFRHFMMRPLQDKWIDNWTPHDSFRNVFLLRDPKWSQNVFENVKGEETGIREMYLKRLNDMQISFLKHSNSDNLFHNKKEMWNASSTPGQSGVDEIVKYMTPVCHPTLKWLQVCDQLVTLRQKVDNEFRKYYIDSDVSAELQKANRKSLSVLTLIAAHREKKIFGLFLDKIVLEDQTAWKIAYNLLVRGKHSGKNKMKDTISIDLVDTLRKMGMEITLEDEVETVVNRLKDFFGIEDNNELVEGCREVGINIESLIDFLTDDSGERSPAEIFADDLITFWFDQLQNLNKEEDQIEWGINEHTLDLIINEIKLTAERVSLKDHIVKAVSQFINDFMQNDDLKIIARLSTHIINDFSGTLGWNEVSVDKRPKNELKNHIFDLGDGNYPDKSELTFRLNTTNEHFFVDWCTGLKETFAANVHYKYDVGDQANSVANRQLGQLLQELQSVR